MDETLEFRCGSVRLNPEQHAIVTAHPGNHQRILAAAGSGKTTTITARIAWLLTHTSVTADQIVLLTFSRNAARDMVGRVKKLVGPVSLWAGTFHALAKQILTTFGSGAHGSVCFVDELPVKWNQWLRTDRGRKWVGKIRYIIVDEFQDINAIQWRLLESLRHPNSRMILVGDDAQNIYTWRGSSAAFLLEFHKVVPTVVDSQLRQNYRSTEAIVSVANRIMRGIPTLPWKEHMIANRKGGAKPDVLFFWRLQDQFAWLCRQLAALRTQDPHATVAILARNNADLYKVEDALLQKGIRIRFLALEGQHVDSEVEAAKQGIVDLATFHGSKGLEWDITFLIGLNDDILPSRKTASAILGERRLFYVAATRARRRMFFTYHGNERSLSRFVREVGYQFLTFHGLAKYALSECELGEGMPSLQSLLDALDGDDWAAIRKQGLLPWSDDAAAPIEWKRLMGEQWKIPSWADPRDFEAFVRLWMKRVLLEQQGWTQPYKDPLRERMIFTVRVFQEDIDFWSLWREEIDAAVKHFFSNTARVEPADFGDIALWATKRNLPWAQTEVVTATNLIAKLRGQLRCLRFEPYTLDEFTIRPTQCVVPTEYRVDVLRSWRRFVNKEVGWRACLVDIWRLACLEQVAEGRTACLFRVAQSKEYLESVVPFLTTLEGLLTTFVSEDSVLNPEVVVEGLRPAGADVLTGTSLIRICGEKKPDMYAWTESCLLAFLCFQTGSTVQTIQMFHPYQGLLWTFTPVPVERMKTLYEELWSVWKRKQTTAETVV